MCCEIPPDVFCRDSMNADCSNKTTKKQRTQAGGTVHTYQSLRVIPQVNTLLATITISISLTRNRVTLAHVDLRSPRSPIEMSGFCEKRDPTRFNNETYKVKHNESKKGGETIT